MAITQEKFCPLLLKEVSEIEKESITSRGAKTLLYFPSCYYTSSLLFQNIKFNEMNTRSKYMLDFYQIFELLIFGNFNNNLISTTRTRLKKLHFPLLQAQEATGINDNFTINPIKKLFQIRGLILQIDFTTCQLPNQTGVLANSRLPITTVFENISDPVNNNTTRFIQFNIGFYVGPEFKPERDDGHLRGPCTIILESIQSFRCINNAQAIRDLEEEIRNLKRKLIEDREERDNKRTKSTTTFTFSDIPTIDNTYYNYYNYNNTNTITTNSSKPTNNIDLSKTTIPPIPPKPTSENYIINKITDVRVEEIIEEIQKLIETYNLKRQITLTDTLIIETNINNERLKNEITNLNFKLETYQNSKLTDITYQTEIKELNATILYLKNELENFKLSDSPIKDKKILKEISKLSNNINTFLDFKKEFKNFISNKDKLRF
ncbi:40790_t:CDS:2 [Gigaspora margarita]|uniref:40790_t:CDS:1 n=1 Tax=Gigaspora margarita TaxID=4874 RepID=A0ABN7UW39_GIGMA|nr:40790_t:CDS:2 [Gigaspora margarita]